MIEVYSPLGIWHVFLHYYLHQYLPLPVYEVPAIRVNRMSKSRRVLATGGKQRIFWLHMVCFEMVLYHNEQH